MENSNPNNREPWKVALAIAVFFPLGLYWLWQHPTLGKNKVWWRCAIAYSAIGSLIVFTQDRDAGSKENTRQRQSTVSSGSPSTSARGRPLQVSVEGKALDNTFQFIITQRTALLRNVKAWATDSTVVVKFDMDTSGWSEVNEGYQFMIRLFDKNGQHLTNVITSERYTPETRLTDNAEVSAAFGGGKPLVLLKAKGNTLEYRVSVRDLRDAAMAEVGFFYARMFGS